jgi:hypothetical protein
MGEAVAQGDDAPVHMNRAPSLLEPIQGVVGTSAAAVANIESLTTTWDSLLQKVGLFTKLMDRIAQVSGRTDWLSLINEAIEYQGPSIRSNGMEHPLCHK